MWCTKQIALGLCLALLMVGGGSCVPRPLPSRSGGLPCNRGAIWKVITAAPGFAPDQVTYDLEPFTVEEARGLNPDTFRDLLHDRVDPGLGGQRPEAERPPRGLAASPAPCPR